MVQTTFKWKYVFFSSVILFNILANSSPTDVKDSVLPKLIKESDKVTVAEETVIATRDGSGRQLIRPGQVEESYEIEITVNGDSFDGRAVLEIWLSSATRADEIVLQATNLFIKSVKVGVLRTNVTAADFYVKDELLYIDPHIPATLFIVVIEYNGQLTNDGHGLHLGKYNQNNYLSMNLHPSHTSRVFPCQDGFWTSPIISFKFNNLEYPSLVSNSLLEENSTNQFRPLNEVPCFWGMIAHNFVLVNKPEFNILLFGRPGISNQDTIASIAINFFYHNLIEFTNKHYTALSNQDGRMNIFGLPDVSTDWNTHSVIGIWEPYLFMEPNHSVKQRSIALPKIAEAMAKQWFGVETFPFGYWRYQWILSGFASYASWEVMRRFQDESQLDVNTLFVTDVIQEGLLRDSYSNSKVLEPEYELMEEAVLRDYIGVNGILKHKAPALMKMMRTMLDDARNDCIQWAGIGIFVDMVSWVYTTLFIEAIESCDVWLGPTNSVMDGDLVDFLEPWIHTNGYPLLHVIRINSNSVVVVQENFGFSNKQPQVYQVPITYTTSNERDFSEDNIYPVMMLDSAVMMLNVPLSSEDWIIFNIQGQGYYRVNYEVHLWERIIRALENPETRKQIHPLNRATLVDDALNIARAGKLDYDIAFRLVLTMQHETEYASWKAFVRNMDFLRKRLVAYTRIDEDLDSDIYLRIIKRTIRAFEDQIGFYPDVGTTEPAMQSLTRGLVMDHACRANYQPCIGAVKNWFYDPNDSRAVNPNIPHDIRPAVYCTMVREGDEKIIEALKARREIEPTLYEKVVILESLACSQDEIFINGLLEQTIAPDSSYGVEERVKIFAAVAGSSYANANLALQFLRVQSSEIRKMYGGAEKLEEVTFIIADNMADENLSFQFSNWVNAMNNNLQDSQLAADRALEQVNENLLWDESFRKYVYLWIVDHAS